MGDDRFAKLGNTNKKVVQGATVKEVSDGDEKRAISVPDIDGDDYDVVQGAGVPLTVFVRKCFKKEANRIRALEDDS